MTWFTVGREYDAGVDPADGVHFVLQDDVVPAIDIREAWAASVEGEDIVIGDIARFSCVTLAS